MKRIVLLLLLLINALRVFPQDTKTTILTFTADAPGGIYHPFSSVNVTNVTRGWTETLVYPDTVLVLMNTTSVDEDGIIDKLIEVFPNPFTNQTNVRFQMSETGKAGFVVYNINGQILASAESWLGQGSHNLTIALEKPQLAILSITTPKGSYVTKLIQTEQGSINDIQVSSAETRNSTSRGETEIGGFEHGDIMKYEAVYEDGGYIVSSDTLTQAQLGDETITLHFISPMGAVKGLFSISETLQVWFSRGNLQYQASTNTWRFADDQFDYIGEDNSNISSTYDGWIDLFGWGTSGWDCGNTYYQPWESNNAYGSQYGPYYYNSYGERDLTGVFANSDWGIYNPILNGGNQSGLWRTMTVVEWQHVLAHRVTPSGIRYAKAIVNNTKGVILLPDDWNASYYTLSNVNNMYTSFDYNIINVAQWRSIEQHGAVFLPASGFRQGTSVLDAGYSGQYWTTHAYNDNKAWYLYLSPSEFKPEKFDFRCYGRSVRLVTVRPPVVTTTEVIDISSSTATCEAVVTSDGGITVTERGVCWSTDHEPTINDSHNSNGSGTGAFSVIMPGLMGGTTYYVRAYAINGFGTAYGEEMSFTTLESIYWPNGVLPGTFSVSSSQQVCFSQGNLQYKASTNTWRFAENQFECIGETNSNISPNYNDYIDLFGWGTSGWDCGNTYYQPWDSDFSDPSLYGPPGQHNLTDDYANSDWGRYNAISNGGDQVNQWRTMSSGEWECLFNGRLASTINGVANARYVKATVNGMAGIILFPDVYTHPESLIQPVGINQRDVAFSLNNYQIADWLTMVNAGAVFLPASGTRSATSVSEFGSKGHYWSITSDDGSNARILYFKSDHIYTNNAWDGRYVGNAVRLVQDYQTTR